MNNRFPILACLCGVALATSGCLTKNNPKATAPVAAAPAPSLADSKPLTTIAPDTTATPPLENVPVPPNPVATTTPPLPVAPQISPQISPGDQATFQRKTEDDIATTQRNLKQTQGKQLSAAQLDLVEKIKSFVGQSNEASKTGDWARAQNLSQKARLLSNELVESL